VRVYGILLIAAVSASAAAQQTAPAARTGMSMHSTPQPWIKTASPRDGAMLSGPPSEFNVTFAQPTTLKSVALTDDTDSDVPVAAAPTQTDASSATIKLPTLDPGTYKLHWVGVDAGGKELTGDLSFMVHRPR